MEGAKKERRRKESGREEDLNSATLNYNTFLVEDPKLGRWINSKEKEKRSKVRALINSKEEKKKS